MALPFDLRAFASSDDFGDADSHGTNSSDGHVVRPGGRPSRAIVVPSDLVSRVQAHDVEAFRELVRLTYVPLVRFAATIVATREEAEDVVQDVFTIVWDRGTRWHPTGDPAAYLFTSVRNHALNEVRRRAREARRIQHAHDAVAHDPTDAIHDESDALSRTIDAETDAIRIRAVTAVLATLTERQRTAYDLRYRRGLTAPAIAAVLGVTVKGAEQLISRVTRLVLERVRQELAGEK